MAELWSPGSMPCRKCRQRWRGEPGVRILVPPRLRPARLWGFEGFSQNKCVLNHFMLLSNELFGRTGVKSRMIMKNIIMERNGRRTAGASAGRRKFNARAPMGATEIRGARRSVFRQKKVHGRCDESSPVKPSQTTLTADAGLGRAEAGRTVVAGGQMVMGRNDGEMGRIGVPSRSSLVGRENERGDGRENPKKRHPTAGDSSSFWSDAPVVFGPQPRWGLRINIRRLPRVVPPTGQPWAAGHNPFGIEKGGGDRRTPGFGQHALKIRVNE